MLLTNLEIHLGASRADSMRHMAQRTKADEIASLVAMLVQTEKFGTSLAESLKTFAPFSIAANSPRDTSRMWMKDLTAVPAPCSGIVFPIFK